jgi:effector-binding domain-containing protein
MGNYESPAYDILKKDGVIEIRRYRAFDTISVNESKLSGYSGFGLLFSYISGNNEENKKIAMTIPVINDFESDGMTMEFVVPNDFSMNHIPVPKNDNLKIKHYDEHVVCSITFKGVTSKRNVDKQTKKVKDWLKEKDLDEIGRFRLARYNPPFSLPYLRRNEVLIEIDFTE